MRLSVQLYTVRDALTADVGATLAKLKEMGLEYVELAGPFGKSAEEWKDMLDGVGLTATGSHVGMDILRDDLDGAIATAKTIGYSYVVLPWIGKDAYADGWDVFAKSLTPYGAKLKEAGLTLAYHNHAFEFENDGLDTFYAAADPDLVKAELDLAWVQIGGADPAGYVKKMAGRVPLVHLKDYDPTKTPQWRPAGQGVVDFDAILEACAEAGVEVGVIELDESPGDPLDAVKESVEFFRSKGV